MKKYDSEIISKAKEAKTPEEIVSIAKENGMEITAEEAAAYFTQLHPKCGELDDDELDNVAGGGCGGDDGWTSETAYRIEGCTCPKGHNTWRKTADSTYQCIPCELQGFGRQIRTVGAGAVITTVTTGYK